MTLLKTKAIGDLLSQVISGNEKSVLLLTKEGNLLSFSSEDRQPQSADNHLYHLHNANYLKEKEAKMNGIKISNLYYSNKDKLENSRNSEGLFFTYENGEKFFLMKIEKNLLLCIIGNNNSQFGMLSMKANLINKKLEGKLSQLDL